MSELFIIISFTVTHISLPDKSINMFSVALNYSFICIWQISFRITLPCKTKDFIYSDLSHTDWKAHSVPCNKTQMSTLTVSRPDLSPNAVQGGDEKFQLPIKISLSSVLNIYLCLHTKFPFIVFASQVINQYVYTSVIQLSCNWSFHVSIVF